MEEDVRGKLLLGKYQCLQSMENAPETEGWYLAQAEEKVYAARVKREESETSRQWRNTGNHALWIPTEAAWDGDIFVEIYPTYAKTLKGERISIEEIRNLFLPRILEALRGLHEQGIAHGNLCLERVAATESGYIVLPAWGNVSGNASAQEDYYALGAMLQTLCADCGDISFARLVYALMFINPEKRWGYAEVMGWLRGEDVKVPFSCGFCGVMYFSEETLADALLEHWQEALHTEEILPTLRLCVNNLPETYAEDMSADCALCELLYILQPKRRDFPWHGIRYADRKRLGEDMLSDGENFADILEYGMLSRHIHAQYAELEAQWHTENHALVLCRAAYALGAKKRFVLRDGSAIQSMEELREALQAAFAQSQENFARLCAYLTEGNHCLNPRFEAWLEAIGQKDTIQTWKNQTNTGGNAQ